jgi:hypothetical protein
MIRWLARGGDQKILTKSIYAPVVPTRQHDKNIRRAASPNVRKSQNRNRKNYVTAVWNGFAALKMN